MTEKIPKLLPERIMFCIDFSSLLKTKPRNNKTHKNVLSALIESIKHFIHLKQQINPKHEYGLITVTYFTRMLSNFNRDPTDLLSKLDQLESKTFRTMTYFSLTKFFQRFSDFEIKKLEEAQFVTRIILFYIRDAIPSFPDLIEPSDLFQEMVSKSLVWDTIILSPNPKAKKKSDVATALKEFGKFCKIKPFILQDKGSSNLINKMALLIANPIQRKPLEEMKILNL
ncbi:hypothetical protein M0813_07336 [Anaeramoeba flamelloides]|uniref:BRISC and BRCA1-A complex member 1 n=1 Tax=Anaeramoeba flamelloides TaxID=1746091 RepID=A0ABQ8XE71_9EUKA|nr:hypothetical protein M0813_07336 [Anaeramoeba flamelloides]